jgi:hypothetical protein
MCRAFLDGSDFDMISTQVRISCSSRSMCFDKVRGSLHFSELTIPWRNCQEEEMHHLDGLTRWCALNWMNQNKHSFTRSYAAVHFPSTSHLILPSLHGRFREAPQMIILHTYFDETIWSFPHFTVELLRYRTNILIAIGMRGTTFPA